MELRYTPVLRLRQQEKLVLKEFEFGNQMIPLIEIIKELDTKQQTHRKGIPIKNKSLKTFEISYLNIIKDIRSAKIFVDLPVHMKDQKGTKTEVLEFLRKVVGIRSRRTEYIIKLKPFARKIIPVISTYAERTGEPNSIILQEKDLRPHFSTLAYRTFHKSFASDIRQIEKIVQKNDFLIVDLEDFDASIKNEDLDSIINKLATFNSCHKILIRAALGDNITNKELRNGELVDKSDNRLLETYRQLKGDSFGDYAGIKKDQVSEGGSISPGFIYYDATENEFYGFRGTDNQDLSDFETIIVPATISSASSDRMKKSNPPFLSNENKGWSILNRIAEGLESGQTAAKFKRIAMLHYLHCMSVKINNSDFEI